MLDEEPKLGRKHIKSFAGGLVCQYYCSDAYFAWLAYVHKKSVVILDLLNIQIMPFELDVERNRCLVRILNRTLLHNMSRLSGGTSILDAKLKAEYDIQGFETNRGSASDFVVGATIITVSLTDDRGKLWSVSKTLERRHADV